MDVHNAPRDSNVVHCEKKRDAQNVRQQNGLDSCRNFADEWLSVYNLMRSDDFIRFFGALRNRVPNLIVYTDRQVRDIKAMCFNRDIGSVLSFDKTFNLGAIYVTASVYKNVVLHRKRTGDHPLFLGPIFIHGHSDTMAYGLFSHTLRICLQTVTSISSRWDLTKSLHCVSVCISISRVLHSSRVHDTCSRTWADGLTRELAHAALLAGRCTRRCLATVA